MSAARQTCAPGQLEHGAPSAPLQKVTVQGLHALGSAMSTGGTAAAEQKTVPGRGTTAAPQPSIAHVITKVTT